MLRIYLVRHGVTTWNQEGRWQGQTDTPLAPEGEAQAERVADRLASEKIQAVLSSDLSRARRTAEAIARRHGLEVETTERLRETGFGAWEGLTIPEIHARGDSEVWQAITRGSITVRPPGSEPLQSVWDRVVSVQREVRARWTEGSVVLVGHGGSLRALLCDALCGGLECMNRFALDNVSLSAIDYTEHRTWVKFVNDTSHLRDA